MILLILLSSLSFAEEELLKAYQHEYGFLASQRGSLERVEKNLDTQSKSDSVALERELRAAEREYAKLQSANDSLHEEVQSFERRVREDSGRDNALLSLWKRAKRAYRENEHAARLEPDRLELDLTPPAQLTLADVIDIGVKSLALVEAAGRVEEGRGVYVNSSGQLVDGRILKVGRIGALTLADSPKVLGPDGQGRMMEVDDSNLKSIGAISTDISFLRLYLFENLGEKSIVRKPGSWLELVADALPAIFLCLLFLMVAWLFAQLARI
jgi:hypothetical protein